MREPSPPAAANASTASAGPAVAARVTRAIASRAERPCSMPETAATNVAASSQAPGLRSVVRTERRYTFCSRVSQRPRNVIQNDTAIRRTSSAKLCREM